MSDSNIRLASAGPTGNRVRSDLRVDYEPNAEALTIELKSKVDYLYRDAIETAIRRVVGILGVATGRLTVEDAGALEWVILARAETCLRRAGFEGPPVLPEPTQYAADSGRAAAASISRATNPSS